MLLGIGVLMFARCGTIWRNMALVQVLKWVFHYIILKFLIGIDTAKKQAVPIFEGSMGYYSYDRL